MEKITIVINGVGGCGKDTLVSILSQHMRVKNVSSITPVVDVAKYCGWDGVKTEKSRKFLSDLKRLLTEFNEYSLNYLLDQQSTFLESDEEIMFVHIREPEEIKKFVDHSITKTYTLLITPRAELQNKVYGNASDDGVYQYNYDLIFHNDQPLEITESLWLDFIKQNIL